MLFVAHKGYHRTGVINRQQSLVQTSADSRQAYAIAISIFLPFMLFHSTKAAPTIDIAPAATDT
jgi:hypothetical protein